MKALPSLPGDTDTLAWGINKGGTIVGYGYAGQGPKHGVVWINGNVYDLNTLVPAGTQYIDEAHGINDAGQIITYGLLLTPVAGE
jgi:probable HAF family extracellular repeat protein